MIHFILTFSRDAADSPFAHALAASGIDYKIFPGEVHLRYRHRIWLVLIGLPKLGLFAIQSAWKSLVKSQPTPVAVILGSHLEAVIFLFARSLLRKTARIYLVPFIFTRRQNALIDRLRRFYFATLFSHIDGVICHSSLEVTRYEEMFPGARGKFAFIPYGLHIGGYQKQRKFISPAESYAFSAGRSGRDYATLCQAFVEAGLRLHIICDSEQALADCTKTNDIKFLTSCYDYCYTQELENAGLVIVPLAVSDISAGQMVLIQAMAYRKPIIATLTPTIEDYLTHNLNAILVPSGDKKALINAVLQLRNDPELAMRLANNAFNHFEKHHCMNAYVRNILAVVTGSVKSMGNA